MRGHCVVVIAEGAESGLIDEEKEIVEKELNFIQENGLKGKKSFLDLARYIKDDLLKYAKEKHNMTLTIRYLNPTYAIRTAPANGRDTNLCHRLAHSAVHSV